jgi:hypothetical protein
MPAESEFAPQEITNKTYPNYSRYCNVLLLSLKHSQYSTYSVATVKGRNGAKVITKETVYGIDNKLLHSHQRSLRLMVKTGVSEFTLPPDKTCELECFMNTPGHIHDNTVHLQCLLQS